MPATTVHAAEIRLPLSEPQRSAIASATLLVNVAHREVGVVYANRPDSTGLIEALFESGAVIARNEAYKAAAVTVREALSGHDPGPVAETAFVRELAREPALKVVAAERRSGPLDDGALADILKRTGTDAVLVVDLAYDLSPGITYMVVCATASLYATPAGGEASVALRPPPPLPLSTGAPEPIYRVVLWSSARPRPGAGSAAERWATPGEAERAVDRGIEEVARLLAFDLGQPAPSGRNYAVSGVRPIHHKHLGERREWYPVRTEDGRSWLRERWGGLASVGDDYP